MPKIRIMLTALAFIGALSCYAQPNLSVVWEDDNGIHNCDQTLNCNCTGSFIPVVFGSKEVLLSRTVAITITNIGTGALTFTYPVFTGSANWTITYAPDMPAGYSLAGGASMTITVKFSPLNTSSLGSDAATIVIHTLVPPDCFEDGDTSTPTDLDLRFNLRGDVTKTAVNYILALDRSGSMSGMWGASDRKIDKLRKAADFFVGLASLRPEDTTQGFPGDRLGLVRYSNAADNYVPLAVVDATLIADASNKLSSAASNDASLIKPMGSTNMSDAVVKAFGQFPVGEKNVLIAFSDGMENVPPLTTDAAFVPTITARASDVDIYSVGMGSDVNPTSLEALSTNSGFAVPRYFFLPDDFSDGTSQVLNPNSSSFATLGSYELNSIYLKIYAEAAGYAIPSDPEKLVCLCAGTQTIFDTRITSSDKHAIFSLFHESGQEKRVPFQLQLINPEGDVVVDGSNAGNLSAKVVSKPDYTIYKIVFGSALPSAYVGEWKVRFIPSDSTKDMYTPIGFGALAFSDLTMETDAVATDTHAGSPIKFRVDLREAGVRTQSIRDILVRVLTPSGKVFNASSNKDEFGNWTGVFSNTFDIGVYTLFVRATLTNSRGEVTTRESTKYVQLGAVYPAESRSDCCNQRYLLWIILALSIAILICILFSARRRAPRP